MSTKRPSLAAVTGRYVGRPFREISCMGLIAAVYEGELGLSLPHTFEDLDLETYIEKWRRERAVVEAQLMRWARTVGRAVPVRALAIWDLVIVRGTALSPAVYVGAQRVMGSTVRDGVEVMPLSVLRPVCARRLVNG